MKKRNIIIFSFIIICGLAGVLFIAIGINGSIKLVSTNNKLFANKYANINKNYTIESTIKELYIDANIVEFIVTENTQSSSIEISITDFIREEDLKYNISGNKLVIKALDSPPILYGKKVLTHPTLTLKIPKNMAFDVVEIYSKASDNQLNDIITENLIIKNEAGKIVFSGSVYGDININNNAGKIDINITKTEDDSDIIVSNNMGDIVFKIPNVDKYNYSLKNNMGEVSIGNQSYKGINDNITSDKADMNIEIDNKMGKVLIL